MPTQITSAFRRFITAIREFTIAQRTIALIGVAVLVLGVAGLATWLAQPSYSPLFTGLAAEDASSIVEQLRADSVPYQLADGGGSIMVPEERVYEQRLKAAAAGLPGSSNGGYSLLDNMGVTSSEFQQSVTYKRALEGELAATISSLKGVKTASVRLAIPEESVFVSTKADPTASVFIETKNGVTLSSDQVQAIVHLTSASIDGMSANNVAVIDAAGTVLSAVGVGATGSANQQASDYESRVGAAVQTMLDKVVGPGNASVVVAADMSYESAERVEEQYETPLEAPVLNEQLDSESYTGAGGNATGGVLGPDNIAVPGADGESLFSSESSTRNNAINKVTESRSIPAGSIRRQSVSVAIDKEAAAGLSVAALQSLVATAAGIDADRGDEVTVEVMAFNAAGAVTAAEALKAAEAAAVTDRVLSIVTVAGIVAAVTLPLIIGIAMYLRRRRHHDAVAIEKLSDILDAPTLPMQLTHTLPPLELSPPPEGYVPGDAERQRADIDALAGRDPQKTAEFLRGLMDDSRAIT